jgi:hypothetical protein
MEANTLDQNQSNQPTQSKRPAPHGPKFNWKLVLSLIVGIIISLLLIIGIRTEWYGLANETNTAQSSSSASTASESSAPESSASSTSTTSSDNEAAATELSANQNNLLVTPKNVPDKFVYDSDYDIAYPAEGVKGIYLSADGVTNPTLYQQNIELLDKTNLNTVVLDVKDDYGNITMDLPTEDAAVNAAETNAIDGKTLMQTFEDKQIYPIARITTFKDTNLATAEPERSFLTADGQVWTNGGGDAFLNPYNKDNWAYLVETAKSAARAGFKDIQFDYVRFPEAFETFGETLTYDMGDYAEYGKDSTEARQQVIADFLAYAREELKPYGAHISADMFGYVTDVVATPGIGQNFNMMAENVDAISAMIYPSHWGPGYFGLDYPDLHPYEVVDAYMKKENALMQELDSPAISRPWLQDFTASYLADGTWKEYGPAEVQEQIDAVIDNGANEYLLWDAANEYSPDVDYK